MGFVPLVAMAGATEENGPYVLLRLLARYSVAAWDWLDRLLCWLRSL
jgi:hypothetical protein